MSNELWVEKYRPQTISEIVGSDLNLAKAMEWMDAFQSQQSALPRALLLSGPPGLGKTTMAHCLLKEYGYRVKEFNASDIRSQKLVETNLHEIIETDCVDKMYGAFKPFGIIMDEVDGMLAGDRGGLSALVRFINPNRGKKSVSKEDLIRADNQWGPPIICICNTVDRKGIKYLKKDCLEIKFLRPKVADLRQLLKRIIKAEKLNIEVRAQNLILDEISQGDYRRLVFFLQYLHQSYEPKTVITRAEVLQSQAIFAHKEKDLNLTETISQLLNQKLDCQATLRFYNNDKSLLPLMIHENYLQSISLQESDIFQRLDRLQDTIRAISWGDLIDKSMYNHQSWHLQPIHGVFSCYIPSYYMNESPKTQMCRYNFTTALSRYSIACTNKKTITQLKDLMSHKYAYSTAQIHHFSRMINRYLVRNQIRPAIQLMNHYKLVIRDKDSDLDRLIRVDRFRENKELSVRVKNKALAEYGGILKEQAGRSKIVFLKSREPPPKPEKPKEKKPVGSDKRSGTVKKLPKPVFKLKQ